MGEVVFLNLFLHWSGKYDKWAADGVFVGGCRGKIVSFELNDKIVIAIYDGTKNHSEIVEEATVHPRMDGPIGQRGGANFEFDDDGNLYIFGSSMTLKGGLLPGVEASARPLLIRARQEHIALGAC